MKSKFTPIALFFVLLVCAAIGYGVFTFTNSQAKASAKQETEQLVNKVASSFDKEIAKIEKDIIDGMVLPPNQFVQTRVAVVNGDVTGLDSYSFGEQALLTKALDSREIVTDIVLGSDDIPKELMVGQKYILTSVLKTEANELLLTRAAIKPLKDKLSSLVSTSQHIAVVSSDENNAATLFSIGTKQAFEGAGKPFKNDLHWAVKSTYQLSGGVFAPKVLGLMSGGILFLLGLVPVLMIANKKSKAAAQAMALEAQKTQKRAKASSAASSMAALSTSIDTDGLPLASAEEASQSQENSTSDNTTSHDEKNTENTANDSNEATADSADASNKPVLDTVPASQTQVMPMVDGDLTFAENNYDAQHNSPVNTAGNAVAASAGAAPMFDDIDGLDGIGGMDDYTTDANISATKEQSGDDFASLENEIQSNEADIAQFKDGSAFQPENVNQLGSKPTPTFTDFKPVNPVDDNLNDDSLTDAQSIDFSTSDAPPVSTINNSAPQENEFAADNSQAIEFSSESSQPLSVSHDAKTSVADDELDDGNVIAFEPIATAASVGAIVHGGVVQSTTDDTATSDTDDQTLEKTTAKPDSLNEQLTAKEESAAVTTSSNHTFTSSTETVLKKDNIFRTYDIRCADEKLNKGLVMRFAVAYQQSLNNTGSAPMVAIGWDTRKNSRKIASQLIAALTNLNVQVLHVGQVTTPMLGFAANLKASGNGIMVTASHCGKDTNGLKWFISDMSPTAQQVADMQQAIYAIDTSQLKQLQTDVNADNLISESIANDYVKAMKTELVIAKKFTVCIDCMHGATSKLAEKLFQSFGFTVHVLNNDTDGTFPSGDPNPVEAGRLRKLSKAVKNHDADIGFAFDGDGDRLGVVDNNGNVLNSEQVISLLAQFVLDTHQSETIIIDAKCSRAVKENISKHGGVVKVMPTGSSMMRNTIKQNPSVAVFAGEYSGHYIFNDGKFHNQDDAMYVALRLLEYLSENGDDISSHVSRLVKYFGSNDNYYPLKENEDGQKLVAQLLSEWQKQASNNQGISLDTTDGFKLESSSAFAIIRASNTENALTVRISGKSPDDYTSMQHLLAGLTQPASESLAAYITSMAI